ncbi:MAG: outer membrane beta-barrel protein [Sulfurifustaceae bacterium]
MKRILRRMFVAISATSLSVAASAAMALDTKFHYQAGYDTGGDTLMTVTFSGGDTQNIKANGGLYFGGGVSMINEAENIEAELAISYKVDDITASNGSVTWSRWPIDALVFYRWPTIRLGAGATYHLDPKVHGTGVISGNFQFKDSLGFLLQLDYRINKNMNIGVRYTALDYEVEGTSASASANGIGVVFSGHL